MRYRANRSTKVGRRASSLLGGTIIAAALLAFLATPALAIDTHPFTGVTIGPGGKAAGGQFTSLQSVTVDPSTGDLYVLDAAANGRLYKFDSAGEPIDFTATGTNFIEGTGGYGGDKTTYNQIAIAPPGAAAGTAGDIYIANGEEVKIYSPEGIGIGHITQAVPWLCGVAVDATGNVFVKSRSEVNFPFVTRYTPTTNPPTNADESGTSTVPLPGSCNLAVDGNGHIFVSATGFASNNLLRELPSLSAETAQLVDSNSRSVAIEPGTNDIYVSNDSELTQYAEDGSVISKFGEGRLVEAPGLSIAGAGGAVYVADRTFIPEPSSRPGRVDVFGPLVALPKAIAGTADAVTKTSAVLQGTIDADGGPQATCKFEYASQAAFEAERFAGASSTPCVPGGPFSGTATEAVSAEISGLTAGTSYRFRIVGENENGALGSDENGSSPGKVPNFETLPAFKVQTGPVENLATTAATLTGSINPEGVNVGECFFEYTTQAAFEAEQFSSATSAPCSPGAPFTGNATVAVSASISGLTTGTEYRFRLVGGSSEFGGVKVRGSVGQFGTKGPPQILAEAFSGVGQTAATISGSINPHSEATSYFVEYVTEAGFAQSGYATASLTEAVAVGSGFVPVEVAQALSGLSPGTKYHFRLAAKSGLGEPKGADRTFTTHGLNPSFGPCPANEPFRVEWSALLPDCRAYEQVSPQNKNGGSAAGLSVLASAAEDGSAVTFYSAAGALPPAERGGTQTYPAYLATRDVAAGSWSSQRLLPPQEFGGEAEYLGSTPDLRYAVVEAGSVEEGGLFVVDTQNGAVTQIAPKVPKIKLNEFGFDGATLDGSRIFFESTAAISTSPELPAPVPGHDNLYMWERATGNVSLVGVLPDAEGGQAPPDGSFGGSFEWYEEEEPATGGALNRPIDAREALAVAAVHAISASGEQVFFTSAVTGQLYLRHGLGGPSPTTTYISTPNSGVGGIPGKRPAAFQEATPDGSRAFFMSRQKLTADAKTGPEEEGRDLYRWDASAPASEALTDIAPDPGDPNGAEVQGLLGISPSGSSGYFIARGKLAEGAEKGGENLYRFAERANGHFKITFIATLAGGDPLSPDRRNVSPRASVGIPIGRTSRVSEDGEMLLFTSTKPLTGYDNENLEGISCGENGRCPELFLYSAPTGNLTCVSCDPTGEPPVGAASLQDLFFNAYLTPNVPPAVSLSHNLSADGARVFFQTPDPLVAADTNGDLSCPAFGGHPGQHDLRGPGRCQDVYEWEAVGSGSCKVVEANGGCLYLLSTGQSGSPSYFVGASKDGSNAFIATDSQLVPVDRDQATDVYDLREEGGLASQQVRPPVPCTSAEACKGSGSASPLPISPATPSFQGPGNPKPKQCKKGYAAKKGKCVKKKSKKKQKRKSQRQHHKGKRDTGKKRSGGAK